jgi:hypothetical protein
MYKKVPGFAFAVSTGFAFQAVSTYKQNIVFNGL